jgi:hypothetical protein
LTIPDAVCTVLCSWWWAEEPPETCRAIYRNKYIEKTLLLFGCILRYTCDARNRSVKKTMPELLNIRNFKSFGNTFMFMLRLLFNWIQCLKINGVKGVRLCEGYRKGKKDG